MKENYYYYALSMCIKNLSGKFKNRLEKELKDWKITNVSIVTI
jgi:hypothetical protein